VSVPFLDRRHPTQLIGPRKAVRNEALGGWWWADASEMSGIDRSYETRQLFESRVTTATMRDTALLEELRTAALSMHRAASKRRGGYIDNNAFFNMQSSSQEALVRQFPALRRLRRAAVDACVTHVMNTSAAVAADNAAALEAELRRGKLLFWAAILRPGDNHDRHVHEGSICSGVLYVSTADDAAPIVFSDPRGAHRHYYDLPDDVSRLLNRRNTAGDVQAALSFEHSQAPFIGQTALFPRDGDMVLFPSYLAHQVLKRGGTARPEGAPDASDARARISYAFNLEMSSSLAAWGVAA